MSETSELYDRYRQGRTRLQRGLMGTPEIGCPQREGSFRKSDLAYLCLTIVPAETVDETLREEVFADPLLQKSPFDSVLALARIKEPTKNGYVRKIATTALEQGILNHNGVLAYALPSEYGPRKGGLTH